MKVWTLIFSDHDRRRSHITRVLSTRNKKHQQIKMENLCFQADVDEWYLNKNCQNLVSPVYSSGPKTLMSYLSSSVQIPRVLPQGKLSSHRSCKDSTCMFRTYLDNLKTVALSGSLNSYLHLYCCPSGHLVCS